MRSLLGNIRQDQAALIGLVDELLATNHLKDEKLYKSDDFTFNDIKSWSQILKLDLEDQKPKRSLLPIAGKPVPDTSR